MEGAADNLIDFNHTPLGLTIWSYWQTWLNSPDTPMRTEILEAVRPLVPKSAQTPIIERQRALCGIWWLAQEWITTWLKGAPGIFEAWEAGKTTDMMLTAYHATRDLDPVPIKRAYAAVAYPWDLPGTAMTNLGYEGAQAETFSLTWIGPHPDYAQAMRSAVKRCAMYAAGLADDPNAFLRERSDRLARSSLDLVKSMVALQDAPPHDPPPLPDDLRAMLGLVREACRECGVSKLWLTGSGATGNFTPGLSDYDFIVDPSEAHLAPALKAALQPILDDYVDVVPQVTVCHRFFLNYTLLTRRLIYP